MNAFITISVSSIVTDSNCRKDRANVVCPKPRRVGLISTCEIDPIRPLAFHVREIYSYQQEVDAKAGDEPLDIIVPKTSVCMDQTCTLAASSPPFYCGSPPSRVSNPLIRDNRFGDQNATPVSPTALLIPSRMAMSPTISARMGGGSVRASFGNNPAVRIEGFDCDHRNHSIPALV